MKFICLWLVWVISILTAANTNAQIVPLMRISVENTETHVQTIAVRRFASELRERLRERIDVRFYANANLFRDQDVIQALIQGNVEMAVPGNWHVSRFEPNAGVFLLPVFYGRERQANYDILDSEIGRTINRKMGDTIGIKVLGRWIDLGHAHLFSVSKKISRHEDIEGLKIRVAGGVANELRIKALKGIPTVIPWPDLPAYLNGGRIDAVLTSYETVKSAKLWQNGIKYVFEDNEYFPQYIPLVRLSFWKKLPEDVQSILVDTWEKHVDVARENAGNAQTDSKNEILKQGVEIVVPESNEVRLWREKIMANQQAFIKEMKIDPDLAEEVTNFLAIGY
jgi:C4-dicarboxylate-binding protein DctP